MVRYGYGSDDSILKGHCYSMRAQEVKIVSQDFPVGRSHIEARKISKRCQYSLTIPQTVCPVQNLSLYNTANGYILRGEDMGGIPMKIQPISSVAKIWAVFSSGCRQNPMMMFVSTSTIRVCSPHGARSQPHHQCLFFPRGRGTWSCPP